MIDYIDARCQDWGHSIRAIYIGKDGWPSRSVIGKLRDEGVLGASCDKLTQHYREVLTGERLETGNAIKQLSEHDRAILFVHYVVIGKGKVKAARLNVSRKTYYEYVNRAQGHLAVTLASGGYKKTAFCTPQMGLRPDTVMAA